MGWWWVAFKFKFPAYVPPFSDHRHISLKIPTSNLTLMLGFRCMCTARSKPNVAIKMMSPYHSMQMSTES